MSIHTVGKRATDFSNEESITFSTLQLVDYVHGFTISMGGDGVNDFSMGAGEGVGGMVNGAGLISGSIAKLGDSGGGDAC